MSALVSLAAPITTFATLVAVGMELTADDFARVARQRALILTGLFAPVVLLPLLAIGLTSAFRTPPELSAAVLLVAACPIGGVCNTYSYLARAATALSVTLTGLSCVFAAITLPVAGRAFQVLLTRPFALDAPIAALVALLPVLTLPVTLGMWIRRRAPELAARAAPVLQQVALWGILVVFALVIADDWTGFVNGLATTVPLAAAFVIGSAAAGWLTAVPVAREPRDRFVFAAEFGARNVAIATAVAVTVLGHLEFARFAATYSLVEVPLMLGAVQLFRRSEAHRIVLAGERAARAGVPQI
jgi:BASS family bile acid:Na+ symporter